MTGAAARRARHRRRLLLRFREAGATDSEHAVSLEQLGESPSSTFDHLLQEGVFRQVPDGRFYMDESNAAEFEENQQTISLVALAIFLIVAIFVFILVSRKR